MKILITGFRPFLGESINPSEMLSKDLANDFSDQVTSLILPVEFSKSFFVLRDHLNNNSYDYVVMLGQAGGRSKISFEKIALNWVQTEHADESGRTPEVGALLSGDLALMSRFPIDDVYAHLKAQSLPVEISFSAGTFVCNDLYYRTISQYPEAPIVFVHVPYIAEQVQNKPDQKFIHYKTTKEILNEVVRFLTVTG